MSGASANKVTAKIVVVGSGYVGLVAAACFAEMGHPVVCVDTDQQKIDAHRQGIPTIHECFLTELVQRHHNRSLRFTTELADAVQGAEAVFIAVGTPQSGDGKADLSYVESVAHEIARSMHHYTVIVEKSTVPVYTNEWIRHLIEESGIAGTQFDVVSNPEFLREGTAVTDFLHPDRIIVGTESTRAAEVLQRIYAPLTTGTYYDQPEAIAGRCTSIEPPPILLTSAKSAELIKHASNAFLAMKISFINTVANLCEAANANVMEVARGMGLDHRIGEQFLQPGIGYGGSCFPKDVAAFRAVAEALGVDFALLSEVEKTNMRQRELFFEKVVTAIGPLNGKRLAVLGLAFKGGTDDIRESPAMALVQMFLAAGCRVVAFDPAAMSRAQQELAAEPHLQYADSEYAAAAGAAALIILTDWPQFGALDWVRIRNILAAPLVLDGRNVCRATEMAAHGFTYISVGKPAIAGMETSVVSSAAKV
ncbi:MAG TPA: UDP-glucose/GDP-mannose dehydrogenase family protein [Acidobacteriaceae bacterium]|jgi:UDPglucose 6-dehydrogenase|nr:UDP-glucose/GDP-mannose dehydrogenase family protein [Acidobacteriaceae bacterium]